jgi:NAD(P)-dependent dehydrogenase (short-subunit alcohol dehydrogenase family)
VDLIQKRILVVGGAGQVGEGIVRQLISRGALVLASSRSQNRLDRLRDLVQNRPELSTVVADVAEALGAEELAHYADSRFGPLDGVVIAIGVNEQTGPLLDMNPDKWREILRKGLDPHLFLAQALLTRMACRPRTVYLTVNSHAYRETHRNSIPNNMVASAQAVLSRGLSLELRSESVRIHNLIVGTPVITRDRNTGPFSWLTADEVGAMASYILSPRGEILRGQTLVDFDRREALDEIGEPVKNLSGSHVKPGVDVH